MRYKYCPECGKKLAEKQAGDDGAVPFCEKCGKYWFDSFASCVIILVANEYNEIAMLRQNYLSDRYASFVSGYMKPGESAEETAMREVKEELGLTPDRLDYAGTYWFASHDMLMHGFIATVTKAGFTLSGEVDSAEWVHALDAGSLMFPDEDGNAMYPMYRQFLGTHGLTMNPLD